jgi:beta-lactamase class A
LKPQVEAEARDFHGELTFYVEDVGSLAHYGYMAAAPTFLSSTIKLVVALAVLERLDQGVLSPDQRVWFGPEDLRDGVGPLRGSSGGRWFTVRSLLGLMLSASDNAAADRLITLIGVEALDAELKQRQVQFLPLTSLLEERHRIYGKLDPRGYELSPAQIQALGRVAPLADRAALFSRMLGHTPAWTGEQLAAAHLAYYEDGVNSGSMQQMGLLLRQISRCQGLSSESCRLLVNLMKACRTGASRIRAGLPPEVPWAHKTGTQFGRACDVGIFWPSPDRPVVIAACTRNFRSLEEAEALMARLGRLTFEELGKDTEELGLLETKVAVTRQGPSFLVGAGGVLPLSSTMPRPVHLASGVPAPNCEGCGR